MKPVKILRLKCVWLGFRLYALSEKDVVNFLTCLDVGDIRRLTKYIEYLYKGCFMDEHNVNRAALLMIQKYGNNALSKAVSAASYYLEVNDNEGIDRWLKIGNAVKEMQQAANQDKKKVTVT